MRNFGQDWRDLAEGFSRVQTLEKEAREVWGERLEDARKRAQEAKARLARQRGRVALAVAGVLALVFLTWVLVLHYLAPQASAVALSLLTIVPPLVALYGVWYLFHTPDTAPDPLNLTAKWWASVSQRSPAARPHGGPDLPFRSYGDDLQIMKKSGEGGIRTHETA